MPNMPNMPHPPKNTNGGDTPSRRGKESATPFYPDAGRIAPTSACVMCQRYVPAFYARVLSLSLMSALLLAPAFAAPALGGRFKLHIVLGVSL